MSEQVNAGDFNREEAISFLGKNNIIVEHGETDEKIKELVDEFVGTQNQNQSAQTDTPEVPPAPLEQTEGTDSGEEDPKEDEVVKTTDEDVKAEEVVDEVINDSVEDVEEAPKKVRPEPVDGTLPN